LSYEIEKPRVFPGFTRQGHVGCGTYINIAGFQGTQLLGSIYASALVDEALDLAAALAAVGRADFAAPVEPQPAATITITPATVPRAEPIQTLRRERRG
jgi:hypothetical protein